MIEDNKNNAVEKVENVIANNDNSNDTKASNQREYTHQDQVVDKIVEERNLGVKRQKEQRKQIERARARERVELARIKAQRKAEKQKMKVNLEREKHERKAFLKSQKQEMKKHEKEQKARRKERNRGKGGYVTAIVTLGIATLVLASVLTYTFMMPSATDMAIEWAYNKSFYSTVEYATNIDLNLSKVMATKDKGEMQKYLVDVAINGELCENELQSLPLQDESKFYTCKLVNQISDFSKYLNNKLINGEQITKSDYETMVTLYEANATFMQALNEMCDKAGGDFCFRSMLSGARGNALIKGFSNLENLSVAFPQMIYDGPFSDGLDSREIKGLTGEEISEEQAVKEFKRIFDGYDLENVKCTGQLNGQIQCYDVEGSLDGQILFAQISKKGGKLIMFSYSGNCDSLEIEKEQAIESAMEAFEKLGIDGMQAVWINQANNVYTINFAYEKENTVIYPDLIKVRVCGKSGMVIGLEARTYYQNHTQRDIGKASISERQARDNVADDMQVQTTRLCIVPIGNSLEVLCYEFSGTIGESTYYVYIDASTGRQVQMFKVISSTEGELLM